MCVLSVETSTRVALLLQGAADQLSVLSYVFVDSQQLLTSKSSANHLPPSQGVVSSVKDRSIALISMIFA